MYTKLLKYAQVARLTYENSLTSTEINHSFQSLLAPEITLTEFNVVPIAFIENAHAQCWIFEDLEANELITCFRGTDSFEDAMTNVNIMPCDLWFEGHYCGRVHKGYMDYYYKLRDRVNTVIDEYIATKHNIALTFVGHSLGGCVILPAMELTFRYRDMDTDRIKCYTFGSPAIGNKQFCRLFNERVPNMTRVVYESDIVPRLPIHNHNVDAVTIMSSDNAKLNLLRCIEHHNMDMYIAGIRSKSASEKRHLKTSHHIIPLPVKDTRSSETSNKSRRDIIGLNRVLGSSIITPHATRQPVQSISRPRLPMDTIRYRGFALRM
jgi:hypothetical protein